MSKRIDDIEVLRAIAIIYVLIEHVPINLLSWSTPLLDRFYSWFGGASGVDLFFVVSGFLITRDLQPKLRAASGRSEFFAITVGFWLRRFWRLIPSAWLWLGVGLIACVAFNQSGAFASFRTNLNGAIASALQLQNVYLPTLVGQEMPNNFLYWSLSLEEQFYLLLPLIILCSGRFLPLVLAGIALWQICTPRYLILQYLVRTDALALGALLALWQQHASYRWLEPRLLQYRALRYAAITMLLAALAIIPKIGSLIFWRLGLVALTAATLVFLVSHDRNVFFAEGITKRAALWVGSRSYALYLTHIPAYLLTREIWWHLYAPDAHFGPEFTIPFIVTALALTAVLSELNFRLVETPLRLHGRKIAQRFEQRQQSMPVARQNPA
jgi:peptidoglycan/LPS O-acetylase OafA/YrhL